MSKKKGDRLEVAVRAVETMILSSAPNLNEGAFLIEAKKVLTVGGVRHEYDLFVTVDAGSGYKSIFVFECKNVADPVGKNDVIVFSEKIGAASAQRGFIVAPAFTRDAVAQAAKDPRIELVTTIEHLDLDVFGLPAFIGWDPEWKTKVYLYQNGRLSNTPDQDHSPSPEVLLCGRAINMNEYLNAWANEAAQAEFARTAPPEGRPTDTYDGHVMVRREFREGELQVGHLSIGAIELDVSYRFGIARAEAESHFDIAGRGRVITMKPVTTRFGDFQLHFGGRSTVAPTKPPGRS